MKDIVTLFSSIAESNWWEGDLDKVHEFYQLATQRENLTQLIEHSFETPKLFNLCEQLVSLTKLVLLDDEKTKTRLRLHIFNSGYIDTLIHNHKWPLYSHILCGKMDQYFYDSIDGAPTKMVTYSKNDSYLLKPNQYHHLKIHDATITLMLRGPDLLKASQWHNQETGKSWDHLGGKADTRKSDLTRDEFILAVDKIKLNLYADNN